MVLYRFRRLMLPNCCQVLSGRKTLRIRLLSRFDKRVGEDTDNGAKGMLLVVQILDATENARG